MSEINILISSVSEFLGQYVSIGDVIALCFFIGIFLFCFSESIFEKRQGFMSE